MIVIRSCRGHEELQACVQMQIDTWGYDATDVIPRKAFLVMQKVGGQVMGAFDTERAGAAAEGDAGSLVGFAMSLPGMKTGAGTPEAYLHSHMLAVRPEYRNRGLGARLKRAQRDEALGRGIARMEWTFDPLEIRNAHLNIAKLGAIVRRYSVDFYGVSSSRLQGGLPTDRLTAEWWMRSERVTAALEGRAPAAYVIEERIEVPAAIYAWKTSDEDRPRAAEVQLRNRARFQEAFGKGLAVLGFVRDAEGNGVFELGRAGQLELD